MKIKAKITISGENAELAAIPLMHDNTDTMKTAVTKRSAVTCFESEKIGSVIASVDDYLMNAKVAEDIVKLAVDEDDERE
ncbi:MAG TPA: KEOPS complex subunit Pcc1 [Desulfobacteria bacterium]|nr:KEOPS complex subunit Pcc1 [Desulfobacteria bacterium]